MLLLRPHLRLATRTLLARATSTTSSSCGSWHKPPPPSPPRRPLPFTLPDLAPHEEAYVRSQVDLIGSFSAEELEHITWDRVEALVRREFPSFMKGDKTRPKAKLFRHLTRSAIITTRMAAALKEMGITEEEVQDHPELLSYSLNCLPRDVYAKHLLDVPLHETSRRRQREPLRGHLIHELMDDLVCSLMSLDIISPEAAEVFGQVRFAPTNCGYITLEQLDRRAVTAFIKLAFPEDFRVTALEILNLVDRTTDKKASLLGRSPSLVAKDFARVYWIFSKLVKPATPNGLFDQKLFKRLAYHVCPLESLVTINDFYETMSKHDDSLTKTAFLNKFSPSCLHHLLYPSLRFPASLRMKILLEVGFTSQEAAEILLSRNKNFSDKSMSGVPKVERIRYSSAHYISRMRHRLQLLRENSEKLGLSGAVDCFSAMTHWKSMLFSIRRIMEGGRDGLCLNYLEASATRGIVKASSSYKTKVQHPASKFLLKYFNCKTKEEKEALMSDAFVSPSQKSVTLGQLMKTTQLLEEERFTKSQMRNALPLLFYPSSLVVETLREMRGNVDLPNWEKEMQEEHFLRLCLYFVEKDFHFGGDGFFVGFKPGLSEGLLAEIDREVGQSSTKMERLQEPVEWQAREEDAGRDSPSPDSVVRFLRSHGGTSTHQRRLLARKRQQQGVRQLHSSGAAIMAMSEDSGRTETTTVTSRWSLWASRSPLTATTWSLSR